MTIVNLETLIRKKTDLVNKRRWELNVAYPALEALGYFILRAGNFFEGTRIIVGLRKNRETWFVHGL